MRFVSFFSGIEMASMAWKPLGWTPVAVAEVDPFACAVLAHHHPEVPNLGDVSKITDEQIEALGPFDVLIMGFPCQDVSNAGKRKGLRNDDGTATRTGLFFDAMRLVRAAHRRWGLRWLVGENVPGLYSSNGGRDFAEVVGHIVGSTFDVPREGWQDTGAAAGPRGMVEWCCLDAQWRSLAQRRERVFFVADFGAWTDRPPVLLERESLSGNPPACVEARQRPAARTAGRARRKGIWEQIADAFRQGVSARTASIARTITSVHGGADEHDAEVGRLIPTITGALPAAGGTDKKHGHGWGQQEWEAGFAIPELSFESATEFLPQSSRVCSEHECAPTLQAAGTRMGNRAPQIALEVTPILETGKRAGKKGSTKDGSGLGSPGDPMFTLGTDSRHSVAVAHDPITFNLRGRDGGAQVEVDPDTLVNMRAASGGSSRSYVAAYGGNDTSVPRDVATCLNAKGGASRMDFESETLIAHTVTPLRASGAAGANGAGIGSPGDPMLTLDTDGSAAIAFSCKDDGRDASVEISPTRRSMTFDKSHANAGGQLAIAFHASQDPDTSGEVTHPLDTDGTSIGIAFDTTQITSGENRCDPKPGDPCHPLSATAHPPAWATMYEVRRLTPVECARLQGVPDDYLDIPYRNREAADGPKYKALGNGFAVPVIRLIGERIEWASRTKLSDLSQ